MKYIYTTRAATFHKTEHLFINVWSLAPTARREKWPAFNAERNIVQRCITHTRAMRIYTRTYSNQRWMDLPCWDLERASSGWARLGLFHKHIQLQQCARRCTVDHLLYYICVA